MAATAAYVSIPRLSLDGVADERLGDDVASVLVEETVEGLARCEVRLNNYGFGPGGPDYLYFDRAKLDFGTGIAVELGPPDRGGRVFSGRISAIEAEFPRACDARIVVLAEDRLQELRMTRRTRTFEDTADAEIVELIAGEHGLTPDVSLDGPRHRIVAQVNQSDLAFLRDRVRAAGGELWVEETTLLAKSRPDRAGQAIALGYGGSLLSFGVRADLAHQCTELGVSGWDVDAKEAIAETAEEDAIASELGADEAGSAILASALAPRREWVVHTAPLTSEEARTVARARFRERARRFVTGTGLADGDARLRVGRTVRLSGLGALFDGEYAVVRVRHRYDGAAGFRTEFDVERPGIGSG